MRPVSESRYLVEGMDCASCAEKIRTAVGGISGVENVSISLISGTMTVAHGDGEDIQPAIQRQVQRLGYRVRLLAGREGESETDLGNGLEKQGRSPADGNGHHHDDAHHHGGAKGETGWWRRPGVTFTLLYGAALLTAFAAGLFRPEFERWSYLIAMFVGLVPIARRAFAAAFAGTPFSIEMLMTIAAIGAAIIGAVEEAAVVILLFLVGELLEGLAAERSRASIRGLSRLVPSTALIEREGGEAEEIPAARLAQGDVIVVRPGDRIAADGEVVSGASSVDEAPVTGESVPKLKEAGDYVFAGTVNGEGLLKVSVTASAEDNTIARVIRLVEEAQERKAPTERFINRFSRYYTPLVILIAALVAVVPPFLLGAPWMEWIYKGLAILLIGCPCALVISTPAAIAAALSAGARRGLLMKGGAVLEEAGRLQTIAFDKTGTLTEGKPRVTAVLAFEGSEREVLRLAAALEQSSSHPIALAILARAGEEGLALPPVTEASAIGGQGVTAVIEGRLLFLGSIRAAARRGKVSPEQAKTLAALEAEGNTVSVLLANGIAIGAITLRDEPRADARSGLAQLKEKGIRTLMLTGDNARTAELVGRDLGIEVRAELLPQDKSSIVSALRKDGLKVGKVGDGINDAPALATADVGIAMGGGTDVALETADAAILHGRVSDVAAMIELSRKTMANIRQNIAIAIGLKLAFLVTTILGITGLWPAILADTGATVLVTANALRLLAWKPRRPSSAAGGGANP